MEWLPEFIKFHIRVNPSHGLPRLMSKPLSADDRLKNEAAQDFFKAWRTAFELRRVTEAEAREASVWMAREGGHFPDEHLAALLKRIAFCRNEARIAAEEELRKQQALEAQRNLERYDQLKARWEALAEFQREEIRAEVLAVTPPFPGRDRFIHLLYYEKLAERLAGEIAK
jgi:hypothetical protein